MAEWLVGFLFGLGLGLFVGNIFGMFKFLIWADRGKIHHDKVD